MHFGLSKFWKKIKGKESDQDHKPKKEVERYFTPLSLDLEIRWLSKLAISTLLNNGCW